MHTGDEADVSHHRRLLRHCEPGTIVSCDDIERLTAPADRALRAVAQSSPGNGVVPFTHRFVPFLESIDRLRSPSDQVPLRDSIRELTPDAGWSANEKDWQPYYLAD